MVASVFSSQQTAFGGGGVWTPQDLASKTYAWWDADFGIEQSSGLVEGWTDRSKGIRLPQTSGPSKPAFGATSLNGKAALWFDGTDDRLRGNVTAGQLPFGSVAFEAYWLVDSLDLTLAPGTRGYFGFGNQSAAGACRPQRNSVGTLQAIYGSTLTAVGQPDGVCNGTKVIGLRPVSPDTLNMVINSVEYPRTIPGGVLPSMNSLIMSIGTGEGAAISSPLKGYLRSLIITQPLTSGERTLLVNYLKADGGIV